eukprot:scaffold12205_cov115-Skeletonema_dohrnii-CCMP3373.AAC.12
MTDAHQFSCVLNIHWFRNDLRLLDNPALCHTEQLTSANGGILLPIFIFDNSRVYGSNVKSKLNSSLKCGPRRAHFILEAVADLRHNLERCGSGLIIKVGKPEIIFEEIAQQMDITSGVINIVCQEEICSEEISINEAVSSRLTSQGVKFNLHSIPGSTLYDKTTLPFEGGVPDTFSPFRKEIEEHCKIGLPLDAPSNDKLKLPHNIQEVIKEIGCLLDDNYMPTLADLGYNKEDIESISTVDPRSAMPEGYRGGETFALSRVKEYIWDSDLIQTYFDTRNNMVGSNYSTKFAPWLACGCLSPRYIARECSRYEELRVKSKSTYWVVFELLVRDYFRLFAMKHGDAIFYPSGTVKEKKDWKANPIHFQAWRDGMTGYPLIDANMRELQATGFMSNRGRQNVCSFLAIELGLDWRLGAEYFEEVLLDYDASSNWLNWQNGAGVSLCTGGRLNRFNILKQSKTYDKGGEYVRLWCPELQNLSDEFIHTPWRMSEAEMNECGVVLGRDYPSPIVDPDIHGGSVRDSRPKKQGKSKVRDTNSNALPVMKSLPTGSYQFNQK